MEDIMASKELSMILDRLKRERDILADRLKSQEETKGSDSAFKFQKTWGKLQLNIEFPKILFNELQDTDVFKDIEVRKIDVEGLDCEWITASESDPDIRLLYLHGGAFMFGDLDTHRHLCAQLAKVSGCSILSVDYRLAPENPFPAALEDCIKAYMWMQKNSYLGASNARRAFIAGDSAGGTLTLTMLLKLKQLNITLPNAAMTLSASTDETRSNNSWVSRENTDFMLGSFAPALRKGAGKESAYLHGHDPKDPIVSPLFGKLEGLPPLLMQVSDAECLRDDSEEFAKKATKAGVDVTLEIWPEMVHVWQAFAPILPEAVEAINNLGAFIRKHTVL